MGSMEGLRYCDDGECPGTHSQRELEMHCQGLNLQEDQRDRLLCETEDGSTVKGTWDDEGQTVTFRLPEVRQLDGSANLRIGSCIR